MGAFGVALTSLDELMGSIAAHPRRRTVRGSEQTSSGPRRWSILPASLMEVVQGET